ncbi:MAG: hypothetical protein ACOZF0_24320 [Thermodesulfobacteriota bacterium]
MKKKIIITGFFLTFMAAGAYLAFFPERGPIPEQLPPVTAQPPSGQDAENRGHSSGLSRSLETDNGRPVPKPASSVAAGTDNPREEPTGPQVKEFPTDIEEIKRQIYDLDIEHVEDIVLLEEVVQTGNADTQPLWGGDWVSVDDFKSQNNGFNLEPQGDGTFVFYPDEETARTYTFFESPKTYSYDPERREFFWEEDYYGKTIAHRARFINENVLAMMLISGNKVTLDIYQKDMGQH